MEMSFAQGCLKMLLGLKSWPDFGLFHAKSRPGLTLNPGCVSWRYVYKVSVRYRFRTARFRGALLHPEGSFWGSFLVRFLT